eukprot:scaffold783_cov118-Cylindrotheca_fusiformis.AAC.10
MYAQWPAFCEGEKEEAEARSKEAQTEENFIAVLHQAEYSDDPTPQIHLVPASSSNRTPFEMS